MATKLIVNLPVKNLNKSMEFFTQPGSRFNPQFTDETANCLIVSECIFVVLLTEAKFKTFIPKKICNATSSIKVLVCLTSESRQKADASVGKAVAAGGITYSEAHTITLWDMDFRIWMD